MVSNDLYCLSLCKVGLEAAGDRIGAHDMLIAATCLRFGHRLATLNEGEFARVAGLKLAVARPYAKER